MDEPLGRLSRRELLQCIGTAIAAGGWGAPLLPPAGITWAAGWLLWHDFKGRKIALAEALRDLKDAGADGIEFTPRPGELEAMGLTIDTVAGIRDLGKGEVDFPGVMRALKVLDYRGWINVEQDFTATSPRESSQASFRYVREVVGRA